MVRQAQSANASAQAVVEAQAATGELLEKLKDAVVEIESLKAENKRLKAQLDQIHSGLLVRVVD
jgi:cell shape-determining protein MreC